MTPLLLWALTGCATDPTYIVEGTVVEVRPDEVVLDHKEIPGLMGAMVMPFDVAEPSLLDGLEPGHQVVGRLKVEQAGSALVKLRVTGKVAAPVVDDGPIPVFGGGQFPAYTLPTHDGGSVVLGPEQTDRVLLTFLYTRCPLPEACPAIVLRLQALQEVLPDGARLVAVTLDPVHDTPAVLASYAEQVGAGPRWSFARVGSAALPDLAMYSGLTVMGEGTGIVHSLRTLVLDRGGRLVERYDDLRWPQDRVLKQLATGTPRAAPGASGTVYPE